MAKICSFVCPQCSAPLSVPEAKKRFNCAHCGIELRVENEGGIISLEELSAVRVGVDKTASELAINRLQQEIGELAEKRLQIRSKENQAKTATMRTVSALLGRVSSKQEEIRITSGQIAMLVLVGLGVVAYLFSGNGASTDLGALALVIVIVGTPVVYVLRKRSAAQAVAATLRKELEELQALTAKQLAELELEAQRQMQALDAQIAEREAQLQQHLAVVRNS